MFQLAVLTRVRAVSLKERESEPLVVESPQYFQRIIEGLKHHISTPNSQMI